MLGPLFHKVEAILVVGVNVFEPVAAIHGVTAFQALPRYPVMALGMESRSDFEVDLAQRNIIINIMKTAVKTVQRDTISTHEMRFQFGRILRAVKAGRALTLTYRNKPLARIVPLKSQAEPSADDPVFRLHELAEPIGPLSNAEIDAAIYGA